MYNTLNCIYGMAVSRDEYDIGEMCSSLSSMLQYALEDETMVTVEEEMNIVKQYLSIMKMRFGDKVKYEINIPKVAENKKIIRMTIQPIVENAFNHGKFYNKKDGILKLI